MESRVEEDLLRNVKRHAGMDEGLGPCKRARDPFNTMMGTLIVVHIRNVADQKAQQRVAFARQNDRIPKDLSPEHKAGKETEWEPVG